MIITVNFNRTPGYKGFDLDIDEVRLNKFKRKGSGVNVLFIDDTDKDMGSEIAALIKYDMENIVPVRIIHAEDIIADIAREKKMMISDRTSVPFEECAQAFRDHIDNKYIKRGLKLIIVSWYMRRWETTATYKYNSYLLAHLPMCSEYAILVVNDLPVHGGIFKSIKRLWNWITRGKYCRMVRSKMDECLNDDICRMHEEYEMELAKKRR